VNSGYLPAALMPVILPVSVVAIVRMKRGFLARVSSRNASALCGLFA